MAYVLYFVDDVYNEDSLPHSLSFCRHSPFWLEPTAAKRKAESKKDTPPAKKAKSEGQGKNKYILPVLISFLYVYQQEA